MLQAIRVGDSPQEQAKGGDKVPLNKGGRPEKSNETEFSLSAKPQLDGSDAAEKTTSGGPNHTRTISACPCANAGWKISSFLPILHSPGILRHARNLKKTPPIKNPRITTRARKVLVACFCHLLFIGKELGAESYGILITEFLFSVVSFSYGILSPVWGGPRRTAPSHIINALV